MGKGCRMNESHKKLSAEPARKLTSRELAKIFSGLIGSLAAWNDVDDVLAAIDHIGENRTIYKKQFELINRTMAGRPEPDRY
jgi:hypothetical protein